MVLLDHRSGGDRFSHACPAGFLRRKIFEISGTRISKGGALMLASRNAGKMTAADVKRHARIHRESRKRAITSTTSYTDDITAGHGPEKDPERSHHSVTLQ
jgi:hypothetical protein